MKFKVTIKSYDYNTYEVEAANKDQAEERAENLYGEGVIGEHALGGFEASEIEEINPS